jgi:tRNA pseudouridine38-40 synthase
MGQVAHFVLKEREFDSIKLAYGLNSVLPHSIRILKIQRVPIEFHAQRSAIKKQYSYFFQQGPCAVPHFDPFSRWIRKPLDLSAMNAALSLLVGKHDFKGFQGAGGLPGSTVREILEANVTFGPLPFPGFTEIGSQVPVGLVRMKVVGTGFLKYMVRGIAGTVLQIGENRRDPSVILDILATRDRNLVGPTAPARALWLERVWYPEIEW